MAESDGPDLALELDVKAVTGDRQLKICSLAARGLWAWALLDMVARGDYQVSGTYAELARLFSCEPGDIGRAVQELDRYKVFDVEMTDRDGSSVVALVSRLRRRRAQKRQADRERALRKRIEAGVAEESPESRSGIAPESQPVQLGASILSSSESVFSFPEELLVGEGEGPWYVPREWHDRWTAAYPAVDVMAEYGRMVAWLTANRDRRKTRRGMARMIVTWLSRNQDRARANGKPHSSASVEPLVPGERPASFEQLLAAVAANTVRFAVRGGTTYRLVLSRDKAATISFQGTDLVHPSAFSVDRWGDWQSFAYSLEQPKEPQ